MSKQLQPVNGFTALQVARLLVLQTTWKWNDDQYKLGSVFTPEEVDALYEELDEDQLQDARNDTRHQGVDVPQMLTWCHSSWDRNYDTDVQAIPLNDTQALGFVFVSGGGKHGDPDSYPWMQEAKLLNIDSAVPVTVTHYTFSMPPEDGEQE